MHKSALHTFLYLQFGFVILRQKNTSAKVAPKMFVKLTIGRTKRLDKEELDKQTDRNGETRGRQTERQTDIFFCVCGLDLETREIDQSAIRKPNASTNQILRKPIIERNERLFF